MKKLLKRFFVGTSFTIIALTGFLTVFILYPNNLFAKRVTYKEFTIYSNAEIKGDHAAILDRAIDLVKSSELYDSSYRYDIFLTNETTYKAVSFKLMGPALARSLDNNIMLNTSADFDRNVLIGSRNKRDLTETIAHEMVHCLQLHRYGILKFNPLSHPPLWKLEGYPEYIAHQGEINSPGYTFTETVGRLIELEKKKVKSVELKPGYFDPIIYFKGRVLVEYLMDIRGINHDQLLSEELREGAVYNELLSWYTSKEKRVPAHSRKFYQRK